MPPPQDELITKLQAVSDPGSFLAFVHALVADRESAVKREAAQLSSPYGPDAGGWENVRIESYLEAAVAWAEDSDFGLRQGFTPNDPWSQFAHFLYAGKIYE
jgi:hypothetical protein